MILSINFDLCRRYRVFWFYAVLFVQACERERANGRSGRLSCHCLKCRVEWSLCRMNYGYGFLSPWTHHSVLYRMAMRMPEQNVPSKCNSTHCTGIREENFWKKKQQNCDIGLCHFWAEEAAAGQPIRSEWRAKEGESEHSILLAISSYILYMNWQ